MKKDGTVFIEHISECIDLIGDYVRGKTKKDFFSSKQLQDSVIRRIEIIGEAVKNLPEDLKNEYPGIPWKRISGMRDILIHEYFGIDLELTWRVAKSEIPKFKKQISGIRKKLSMP